MYYLGYIGLHLLLLIISTSVLQGFGAEATLLHFGDGDLHNVLGGRDVLLQCTLRDSKQHPVTIFMSSGRNTFVKKWSLINNATDKYSYYYNVTEDLAQHVLIVKNISKDDSGTYECIRTEPRVQQSTIQIRVLYKSSEPICLGQTTFFTDDQDAVDLRCEVEHDVNTPLNLTFAGPAGIHPNYPVLVAGSRSTRSAKVTPSIDMNGTSVNCTSHQEIPLSSGSIVYSDSCTFTPFKVLTDLDINVYPSTITTRGRGGINLTFVCSSNAGNMTHFRWNITPNSSRDFAYTIEHDRLTFDTATSDVASLMKIESECMGSFGNRSSSGRGYLYVLPPVNPGTFLHIPVVLVIASQLIIGAIQNI